MEKRYQRCVCHYHWYGRGGTGHPGRAATSVPDGSRGGGVAVAELVLRLRKKLGIQELFEEARTQE